MEIERLAAQAAVRRARRLVHDTDAETVGAMLELVRIPAPSFAEADRGARIAERFAQLGLEGLTVDEAGNVLARVPGAAEPEPPVVVAAHLDTVFPADTPLEPRRRGDRIFAPGIADNARGLAALLALARAVTGAGVATRRPVVLAATVGEEGLGDLYGVKHLFREGSPWRGTAAFIGVDGSGRRRIVHRAVGSRRLRITATGAGGHSWADWGTANPVHALGQAIAGLAGLGRDDRPRTSLTVGRMAGGTSVNSIPERAWAELDMRSEQPRSLARIEALALEIVRDAVESANAARRPGTAPLELDVRVIGDRPSGETPARSPLVRAARDATRLLGETPELVASSTDANVPIALGIPAIALGAGGESGGTHTVDEWYANRGGPEGIERVLLTALAAAGLAQAG